MLDGAGEDDWGLWEVLAGIRTGFPGRDEAELRALELAWEPAGDEPSYLTLHITPAGERAYRAL